MAFITNKVKVNSDKVMGWKTKELRFQPWHRHTDFPWTPYLDQLWELSTISYNKYWGLPQR